MKRVTRIKHLLLVLMALVCAGNAWAETKTFTLSYSDMTLTGYSVSDDGFSHLTGKSGTKAEGCELILMKTGKEWSAGSIDIKIGDSSVSNIKVSNGAQNKCILPDGWKATKVTFYSYVNGTDLGTSYWKEVGDITYDTGTTKTFKSAKNGENPDVVSFDLDNVTEFTFTNTGKQICFAAVVEATDGGLEYNIEVVSAPESAGVVEVAQAALDETQVSVKLTATPNVGYYFQKWVSADGEILSTVNPYSYTATSGAAIKAVFGYCEISPIANADKNAAITGTSYTIDGTYNPGGTGSNYGSMLKQASVKLRTSQENNTLTFGVNDGWKITGITLAGYANDAGTISVTSASVDGVAVKNFATVTFPANTEKKSAEVKLENISALESVTLNFDNSNATTKQIYATYTVYYEKSGLYNINVTCNPEEGGFVQRTQNTRADGVTDDITLTVTANKHYTFKEWQDAEGNLLSSVNPYSFETTADKSIVAVFEEDAKYSVVFSKDESVEGQVPVAVSNYVGETVTVPANFWLYKEGYTLTGWTDGVTTYTAGQKIIIAEQDVTLTPVFTANTVSLAERTADVTIRWIFGREEGAPIVAWEGTKYPDMTWVTQANVNGETIDVRLGVDASSGKMNNASRTDKLCQVNGGTKYYVPVCDGATISMEANNVITTTTVAGEAIGDETKTPSYTYKGSEDEVEIVIGDGSYYRYIQVVLPANILLVEDGKNLEATGTFESATYTRSVNTAYNYGTICLPFAPDAETCAKYTFYALDSYGANTLVFTEVNAPVANTAYLYCAADKQATTHTFTGGETTVSSEITEPMGDYKFIGVLAQKEFSLAETTGTFYVYKPTKENDYKDVFGKAVGTTMTVKPYRAYIHATVAAQSFATMRIIVRGAGDNGDGTTGIEEVITPDQIEGAAPAAIYNLMGQPVAQPVKGQIYIVNGKKVVY